jgi:3-mercaptopropionate dioxygenase
MATRTELQVRPAIRDLAREIESIVREQVPAIETARRVAGALQGVLGEPDLLLPEQETAKSDCYCQHVLYADPDGEFSIVSLVWLPGQRTCIHDHISWCVVGVYQGAEESNLYRVVDNGVDEPHLVRTGHMIDPAGSTSYFVPPGDIHEVANTSTGKVISIHVYGADVSVLGSSIRHRYDLPIR